METGNNPFVSPDINVSGTSIESQAAVCDGDYDQRDEVDGNADRDVPAEDEDSLPSAPRPRLVRSLSEKRVADIMDTSLPDIKRSKWQESDLDRQSSNHDIHDRSWALPSPPPDAASSATSPTRFGRTSRGEYYRHNTLVIRVPDFCSRDTSTSGQTDLQADTQRPNISHPNSQASASSAKLQCHTQSNPGANQQQLGVGESLGYVRPGGYTQSSTGPPRFYRGLQTNPYQAYQNNRPNYTYASGHLTEREPLPAPYLRNGRIPTITVTDMDASDTDRPAESPGNQTVLGTSPPNPVDLSGRYLTVPGTRRLGAPQLPARSLRRR